MDAQGERSVRKQRQLLDAAERVYHRHGDLGLTVRRLAAEADATSQTIYTYFGSRDAVIDGMYDRITSEVTRLLEVLQGQLVVGGDDGRAAVSALTAAAVTYRRYCVAHPARFSMLSGGHGPEGWDPTPMVELRARLVAMIGKSLAASSDADERSRLLLAAWNGLIQAQLDGLVPTTGETEPPDRNDDEDEGPAEPADELLGSLVADLMSGQPLSGAASTGS